EADAVETPIGFVPTGDSLDVDGLDMTREQVAKALKVDAADWEKELPLIQEWFDKFGEQLPAELWAEFDGLKARVSGS
ncbi:MAG TPA: phosphoenolpyruvate carboxykinase domain-containing protein, partial [Propionibacteriaceae bacterium]|nr:phosphoenolpyruvate carboxykinase domain-containing protein [Propionibacteriaceae bacterium]